MPLVPMPWRKVRNWFAGAAARRPAAALKLAPRQDRRVVKPSQSR